MKEEEVEEDLATVCLSLSIHVTVALSWYANSQMLFYSAS